MHFNLSNSNVSGKIWSIYHKELVTDNFCPMFIWICDSYKDDFIKDYEIIKGSYNITSSLEILFSVLSNL